MPSLPSFLTQKVGLLPAWAWAGGATVLGAGFIVWRRRGKAGAADAAAQAAQGGSGGGLGGGMAGGFGGGSPGDLFGAPQSPGGGISFGSGSDPFAAPVAGAGSGFSEPVATPGLFDRIAAPAPAMSISTDLGSGELLYSGVLQNTPFQGLRFADANAPGASEALLNMRPGQQIQFGSGSATDRLSELPGGLAYGQATIPGSNLNYSIYGSETGSGPIVAPDQRKAGERYDNNGRVIA
jgi:hypothetical protein